MLSALASVLPYHLYVRGAASADSSRTCSESLVFSLAILPETHVHVSKKSYIDFGDNFNFGELVFFASLIVGELVCRRVCFRRVGLSASWTVGELDRRRVKTVGELVCRRVYLQNSGNVLTVP